MTLQPPAELGRGVVVLPGDEPPLSWASCPRVVLDDTSLEDPAAAAEELHGYWFTRRPVVVELGVDPAALRAPEHCGRPVYELTPHFEFSRERLQFLVWANNYDARSGVPIWWHGRKAARAGAAQGVREVGAGSEGSPAADAMGADATGVDDRLGDIVRADGSAVFIDGGPPQPPELGSGIEVVHRWNAEAGRLGSTRRVQASSDLAPDQLAAVYHRAGPARVIAPAGSGKTRVLTERLRHLVTECGVHPATITALAYNNKAAAEMR
jgi:hypothetical protein